MYTCINTTYMYIRNIYPEVGSVLRAIIARRPEDSLRPVLSYPTPGKSPSLFERRSGAKPLHEFHLQKTTAIITTTYYTAKIYLMYVQQCECVFVYVSALHSFFKMKMRKSKCTCHTHLGIIHIYMSIYVNIIPTFLTLILNFLSF